MRVNFVAYGLHWPTDFGSWGVPKFTECNSRSVPAGRDLNTPEGVELIKKVFIGLSLAVGEWRKYV